MLPTPSGRLWRRLIAAMVASLLALLIMVIQQPAPPPVQEGVASADRQLVLESMQLQTLVLRSGAVSLQETIRARFEGGPWQGLVRAIPVISRAPGGAAHRLGLQLGAVTSADGTPYRTTSQLENGERRLRIYIPDAAGTTRTAVLRYRADHAIRFFADHDELYWNVTGTDRQVPIERAGATVVLPQGTRGIRAAAYTGTSGSIGSDAVVAIRGSEVQVETTRPLQWNEGLTLAVAFDKGSVREPGGLERGWFWLQANWIVVLPLGTSALMLALWQQWGRDPQQGAVVVRYEPPADLAPAEAGALIDDSVDGRDLMATMVDLAIRGYLKVERTSFGGLFLPPRYRFSLLRSLQDWGPELRDFEHSLLAALFPLGQTGEAVRSEDLENSFYTHVPGLKRQVQQGLIRRGCFRHWPQTIRSIYGSVGVVVLLLGFLLAPWFERQFGFGLPVSVGSLVVTAAAIAGIGWLMPRRTLAGARLCEQVCGYGEFIARVDRDRIDRTLLTPEQFERGLPYAMAFGLSRRWSEAFAAVLATPPAWYVGEFDPDHFGGDLDRFSNSTAQVLHSAPRSSSDGSGFGGGGGVGGGFGGGSVGGF
ncbi:MAG: DUF2207 domain-containing protein [Cyanobacteria bacterium K_DeepCast_35m_m2_023]|nr:DUF2207 domain-containing protein [Cyanobacteria bacterium K_DeepCast_35m_m2_023]